MKLKEHHYVLRHEHKHGESIYPFMSAMSITQLPSKNELAVILDIDYDEKDNEFLEIMSIDNMVHIDEKPALINPTWTTRWMDMVDLVASWSKDRSTKVGCVIIDDRQVILSSGWNGFPRGIDDTVESRHERPAKYKWTEHAERNAIYNAAANGIKLRGATMFIRWFPCSDCARAIIQSGIATLVCTEPNFDNEIWGADFRVSHEMLVEAKINIIYHGKGK